MPTPTCSPRSAAGGSSAEYDNIKVFYGNSCDIKDIMKNIKLPPGLQNMKDKYPPAYKKMIQKFNRHALHAEMLELIHPTSNQIVKFDAPLPQEYLDLVKSINLLNE